MLFIALLNAVNFVFDGVLFSYFALNTEKIFLNYEFWRLLSYPFIFSSAEGLFLFVIIFVFLSPKLEYFLSAKIYPLFLSMISFVIGATTTIVFNTKKIEIGGMEGISFFVIALFIFLLVRDKYLVRKRPALMICITTVAIWGAFKVAVAFLGGIHLIVPSLVFAVSGFIIGFLVYLQIHYVIKIKIKRSKVKTTEQKLKLPSAEELTFIMYQNPIFRELITNSNVSNSAKSVQTDVNVDYAPDNLEQDTMNDEERLNMILEKIFENGKDSISPAELSFLEKYSNKL